MAENRPELDKRLQEMHTSQMTESAVNLELVEWLKKYGLNILLVFLLALVALRGYWWLQDRQEAKQNALWGEYFVREIPSSLVDLAEEAEGIGAISELALRKAARLHYQTLIRQEALAEVVPTGDGTDGAAGEDGTPDGEDAAAPKPDDLKLMSAEERADLINQIDRLYTDLLERTKGDDKEFLLRWEAMMSLAAVAEMRGEPESARTWYDQLHADITQHEGPEGRFEPWLREVARRQETLDDVLRPLPLPRAPAAAAPLGAGGGTAEDDLMEQIRRQLGDAGVEVIETPAAPGPVGPMPDEGTAGDPAGEPGTGDPGTTPPSADPNAGDGSGATGAGAGNGNSGG